MAIPLFLAMTAAEFTYRTLIPPHIAWMACHFSPYGTGLTNLPRNLPEGSLLIVNDRTPVCGHDPDRISQSLLDTAQNLKCCGILLDFQRPGCEQIGQIIEKTLTLPLPVAVSDLYAAEYACPVFLSPPAPHKPLAEHIAPWQGREIWLETALDSCIITVTDRGSTFAPLSAQTDGLPFRDDALHCHYRIETGKDFARFTLVRAMDDIHPLLLEAETLGITQAVGLYQELGQFCGE